LLFGRGGLNESIDVGWATATIPIVTMVGNPIKIGLVDVDEVIEIEHNLLMPMHA
jgi:hypothetical protein